MVSLRPNYLIFIGCLKIGAERGFEQTHPHRTPSGSATAPFFCTGSQLYSSPSSSFCIRLVSSTIFRQTLTHFPNRISHSYHLDSPYAFKWLLGGIFHFYSTFNRTLYKQTGEDQTRRRVLIKVSIVFLSPIKMTLG